MPTSSSSDPPPMDPVLGLSEKGDSNEKQAEVSRQRSSRLVAVAIFMPLAFVVALLVWGFAHAEYSPSGVAINNDLGVIPVKPMPAADFSITTFDGDVITLSDLRGNVVMIDFWASWCPPCRREARDLAEVYELYRGMPVEFIGIDVWDTEQDALAYIERYGIGYPNGPDTDGSITVEYGVAGIPEKLFVNREGILVKKIIGPMDARSLIAVIDELLDAPLIDIPPAP